MAESTNGTWRDGLLGAIGDTPLIRLRRASEATGCTVLGKAEFLNPGASVKDRAALLVHEGLSVGGSSGVNIAAAIRVARALGPGHTVVTVLADGGARYQSKLFNPAFLRAKGLPVPSWLDPPR